MYKPLLHMLFYLTMEMLEEKIFLDSLKTERIDKNSNCDINYNRILKYWNYSFNEYFINFGKRNNNNNATFNF